MRLPDRLQTDRLVLRRPVPSDGPAVQQAVSETLPSLARWFRWAQLLERWGDLDDMGARAVSGNVRFDELDNPVYFVWAEPTFLGEVMIDNPAFESHRTVELQLWLRASAHGRGLATEALRSVLAHLFVAEGVEFVEARIASENAPSRKLFARLGFRPHGLRTGHDRYVLTVDDWTAMRHGPARPPSV